MGVMQGWFIRKAGTLAILAVLVAALGAGLMLTAPSSARADKAPIRIGIIEPPPGSGTEVAALRDVMLMLIEEQNRKGGLLNRKLEAVVISPGPELEDQKTAVHDLISRAKVAVVFGTSTDEDRKALIPVVTNLNGILFDPAPDAGGTVTRNVFHTGAAPGQLAIPAVDFLAQERGIKRWVLAATDAPWPRAITRVIENYLRTRGVAAEDIMIVSAPREHSDWAQIAANIRAFDKDGQDAAVLSVVLPPANAAFFTALTAQGIDNARLPVLSLAPGDEVLTPEDILAMKGQLAVRNYVMSNPTPDNKAFLQRWRTYTGNPQARAGDAVEAHYIGFQMWVKAVAKAGTTNADQVIDTLPGIRQLNLTGGISEMRDDHRITRPVFIGAVSENGVLDILWKSPRLIPGQPWTTLLKNSPTIADDWARYNCEIFDSQTNACVKPGPQPAPVAASSAPQAVPNADATGATSRP